MMASMANHTSTFQVFLLLFFVGKVRTLPFPIIQDEKWARKDSPVLGFFPSKPSTKRLFAAFSAFIIVMII